jgi:hypothetical protein
VHLQAQPTQVQQQHELPAGSSILGDIVGSLPSFAAATARSTAQAAATTAPAAAAVATVDCSAAAAAAITGCADSAQLDALLQLAAVCRGILQPNLAAELQVPAAAELYLSPSAAAGASTGSSMQLAAAAVRPGLSAASMTADFSMQAADGSGDAATGVWCSIVGLQAKRATAAALVQEVGVPAARRVMEEQEDIDEVRIDGMQVLGMLLKCQMLCVHIFSLHMASWIQLPCPGMVQMTCIHVPSAHNLQCFAMPSAGHACPVSHV